MIKVYNKSNQANQLSEGLRTERSKRLSTSIYVLPCLALSMLAGASPVWGQTVDYSTPSSFTSVGLKNSNVNSKIFSAVPVTNNALQLQRNVGVGSSQITQQTYRSVNASSIPTQYNNSPSSKSNVPQTPVPVIQTSVQIPQPETFLVPHGQTSESQMTSRETYQGQNVLVRQNQGVDTSSVTHYQSVSIERRYEQEAQIETLADATRIALSESRTQRALALKNSASRSDVAAARSLRNPKISNTTSYVGIINQPTTVTEVDLSGPASQLQNVVPGLAPVISKLPNSFEIDVPLSDKNFVTTVTSVTLPIYLGGRVVALTRAAEAMAQATAAGEEVGEQAVKLQVTEAYFLVLRTRSLRQVAIEAVQTAEGHCRDAEKMFNVGLLTRNVVLAAQVALSEAQQNELKVANAQQLAESAYNRLLWRPLDAPVTIADVELDAHTWELETLTLQAVRSRGELQVLAAESRALQEKEKIARADVLPQIAAVGAYSYFENSHLKDNSNATAAIGMTWTPMDGGTSRARQNAARQNAMAMARVRDEMESGIRLQVRQAWLAEQEARQRVEVARVAVEQAEENLRVVTRGFQEGAVNHTETLDAATMNTAAKSNYANARYDAILATQRLRYAAGIL